MKSKPSYVDLMGFSPNPWICFIRYSQSGLWTMRSTSIQKDFSWLNFSHQKSESLCFSKDRGFGALRVSLLLHGSWSLTQTLMLYLGCLYGHAFITSPSISGTKRYLHVQATLQADLSKWIHKELKKEFLLSHAYVWKQTLVKDYRETLN